MKYNSQAFNSINDRRYKNWDGYSLSYTYEFIKVIENYLDLNEIEVVFDIGSRDGCQALEFADWFPESKIYLFEPVPTSYQFCVENAKQKNNIICNDYAIAEYDGKTTFYQVVNGNVGASSLFKVTPAYSQYQQQGIDVNVLKAKTFIEKNNIQTVDLLWVDVQGAEINCFSGFEEHLQNVKAIHTEVGLKSYYENGTDFDNLQRFMDANNFKQVKVLNNDAGYEVDVIYLNKKFINE